MLRKLTAVALLLAATLAAVLMPGTVTEHRTYAQFVGATQVPGFFAIGSNAVVNAAIGSGGAVTNPASNFIVLIQGSPVYCFSSEQMIPQSTITLAANTTYMIVWNCGTEQLYAKTAVTAPGTSPTTGLPATLLFPIPGVEMALATVVCNATACGNGGNGSITDARSVGLFPGSGTPLNTSTFTNLPTTNVTDGTMILCSGCTQVTTGSATCTTGAVPVLAVRVNSTWRCY